MKRLLAVILVLLAILPASAQVRHKFTNSIPDTPGFAGTKPSDWNDTHTMVATNAMGTIAGTTTIDWNTGWNQSATLTANVTLVLLNPVNAATYTLILTNAGGFTVTFPAEVQWPGGATPSINSAADSVTVVTLTFGGTKYTGLMNTTGVTGGSGGGGGAIDGVYVTNSAVQSVATATEVVLSWNTERYDDGGLHSTSSNTSRLTAVRAGHYTASCSLSYDANATGERWAYIAVNGVLSDTIAGATVQATAVTAKTAVNVTGNIKLGAGDYIECVAYQTSGISLNVNVSFTSFSMHGGGN